MFNWAADNARKLTTYVTTTFNKADCNFLEWLAEIKKESTLGDELSLYCLSNMYVCHVHVHTKKWFWTTVLHKYEDQESDIMTRCELSLIFMGGGRFSEYIPVKQPSIQNMRNVSSMTSNTVRPRLPDSPLPIPAVKPCPTNNPLSTDRRSSRKMRCVNYADLNLGIDTESVDKSPPRKKKCNNLHPYVSPLLLSLLPENPG